jgi:phosphoserine phosphatase RsbU/P
MSDDLNSILQLGEVLESKLSQLEDKLEDQINKIIDLSRMGAVITSVLDLDLVLPIIIETAIRLFNGEVGQVFLFDRNGEDKAVSWGLSQEVTGQLKTPTGDKVYRYIRKSGASIILDESALILPEKQNNSSLNLNTFIASPLKTQDKVIGAIAVANKEGDEAFNADDQFALETLGSFAAVAVTNADLHTEALQNQKYESELEMASQVQNMLMPEKDLVVKGLEFHTYNAQAAQVGGDFYDIIEVEPGKYLVVVADVSNKGIPAALIMASVQAYIRLAAENMNSPANLAAKINTLLCRDVVKKNSIFVTMFFGIIDMNKRQLICANAGHPPAILFRAGQIIKLSSGGPFLGQFPEASFREEQIDLRKGDRLIMFTDGLYECVNVKGQMLGLDKSEEFLRENIKLPWEDIQTNLKVLLKTYSYDIGRVDDTTLMMVEVLK